MTTTTTKSNKSRKSQSAEAGLTAAEMGLLEETVAPVVQAEQEASEEAAKVETAQDEEPTEEVSPVAEAIKGKCETEEERKAALEKVCLSLVKEITRAVLKAEGTYAAAWVNVGLMSLEFVRNKQRAGHGYGSAVDILKAQLVLIAPQSYATNVDQLIRAGCAWRTYCDAKKVEGDKDRDAIARAIPWRTWFAVLSSLTVGTKSNKGETDFSFLPYAADDCVTLIANTIKEGWKYDDVLEKAGAVRRTNATNEAATQDQIRRDAEEKAKGVKEEQQRILNEKAKAETAEKKAKEEAERLENEAAEKVKAAEEAAKAAEAPDADEEDEAAAEEALAIAEESKIAAQKAKEEEERQKQEAARLTKEAKEAEEKRRALNRTAESAAKIGEHANKEIVKIDDAANKRSARLNGNGGGKSEKTPAKDEGENMLESAKRLTPADLASRLAAEIRFNPMRATCVRNLLYILDSDEGKAMHSDDSTLIAAIKAAVDVLEAAKKPTVK